MRLSTKLVPAIIFLLSSSLIFISFLAPLTEHLRLAWSQDLYRITRMFCHQVPTRCIWFFHSNMAICSHCFGVLLGVFIASFYSLSHQPAMVSYIMQNRKLFYFLFAISTIALIIEVGIQSQHMFHVHPHTVRVLAAFIPSFLGVLWLNTLIMNMVQNREVCNAEETALASPKLAS